MWTLPPVIQAGSEADQSSFSERKWESVDGDKYPEVWGVRGMCRSRSVCGSHFQMCLGYGFLHCNTVPLIRNICTAGGFLCKWFRDKKLFYKKDKGQVLLVLE